MAVLAKMHAAPKADTPIITGTHHSLSLSRAVSDEPPADLMPQYDGFLFGIPTRYGRAVASASAFFDATGGLWAKGALTGKFAGIFTSSASQHGGQETTALTTIPFFAHHGIA
jgi:NAD(P)H dehydrogenase (quinone)